MKHIFYKEFIKLKLAIIVVFSVNIAVNLYSYFRIRVGFIMQEPAVIWFDIISKNAFYFDRISMPFILSAFILGVLQFYIEADKKRFRLSCHLPLNEVVMTFYMQFFGLTIIFLLWLVDLLSIYIISYVFFPYDLVKEIINVFVYKLFIAFISYMIASSISLEYSLVNKLRILFLSVGILSFFTVNVYKPSLIHSFMGLLTTLVVLLMIYFPAINYRAGGK